jgi:hypothetical protein
MLNDGGSCNRQVTAEGIVEENVGVMVFRDGSKSHHHEQQIPANLTATLETCIRLYARVGYEHPLLARWEYPPVYTYVSLNFRPCFHICPVIPVPRSSIL